MTNKHMKVSLISLVELQIKTTVKYHYLPIQLAKIKAGNEDW
jgi:hypothetical protein